MRSLDPYTFDATGISKPVGLSNSNAGPPPALLHARSVTAAISRSGLTGSATRVSNRRLSRSVRKSLRSAYISGEPRSREKTSHEITKVRKRKSKKVSCFRVFVALFFRVFVFSWLQVDRHFIGYLLRQGQRPTPLVARHLRRSAGGRRLNEVLQLSLEGFFAGDLDLATLDRRHPVALDQPPHFQL